MDWLHYHMLLLTIININRNCKFDLLTRFDFEAHILGIGWLISQIFNVVDL